ncbi:MAG: hypothetical protein IGQ45_00075 [Cyanobacterium sp. T60_A2020_053]|nr:hypothetical protein [Cyanobacterium sp. T60_A2020_053]
MLYLAEVKTQDKKFVGGFKTELKLLASQSADQTWNTIGGEDTVTTEAINDQTGKGALYIINLDNNKQLQGAPEVAGSRIVNYLRHFSRTLEKAKSQEEEIEEWKTSLQIQGEEIAKRQGELDLQQQRLQEQEGKLSLLEEEKNKLTTAWDQLRNEQQRLNENKLDQGEIRQKLEGILNTIRQNLPQPHILDQSCQESLTGISQQQSKLDEYWHELEYSKGSLNQQRQELAQQQDNLQQRRQELLASREELAKAQLQLEISQNKIKSQESLIKQFNYSRDGIARLQEEIGLLGDDGEEQKVDIQALETMPLGDLESIVNQVKDETAKVVNFVNMQEEELTLQADEVRDIEQKILHADEVTKLSLEEDFADAKEAMKLLNETLVGQRRNLKKQQKILNEYLKVFSRRKGIIDLDFAETINIRPLLVEVGQQRNYIDEKINHLSQELNDLKQKSQQDEQNLSNKQQQYQNLENQLHSDEENVRQFCFRVAEIEGKVNFLESALHPLQNQLNQIRNSMEAIQGKIGDLHNGVGGQNVAISELQSMLN